MKKMPLFYKIYLSSLAVFLVVLALFLVWLKGWVEEYNKGLPETISESFFNSVFVEKDVDRIIELSGENPCDFETNEHLKKYILPYLERLSYTSVSSSDENEKKYVVKSGEYKIADFNLKKSDGIWTPEKISLYLPEGNEYYYKVLSSDTLYLNEKAVPIDYITATESLPSSQHLPEWVKAPEWITYTVSGLLFEPEVKVIDRNGNLPQMTDDNGVFTAEIIYDEQEKEVTQRILEGALKYSTYMQNDATFSSLNPYFEKDTELYKKLQNSMTYWAISHSSYEFEDVEISEFFRYDEETVSVRISFVHVLKKNFNEDYRNVTDITFIARLIDGEYMIYSAYNN